MEFRSTRKGLLTAEFVDRFGARCSIQESSKTDENCVWLGVETDFNGQEVPNGMMLLTQELASQLLPILRRFARNGTLEEESDEAFRIGSWVVGVSEDNRGVEGRIVRIDGDYDTGLLQIQDWTKQAEGGQHTCLRKYVDRYWAPCKIPEEVPTRYERLNGD